MYIKNIIIELNNLKNMKSQELNYKKFVKNNPYHIKVSKKNDLINKQENRKLNQCSSTKDFNNQKTKKNRLNSTGVKREEINIKNNCQVNEANKSLNYKKITSNNLARNSLINNYYFSTFNCDIDNKSQKKTNMTTTVKKFANDDEIYSNRVETYKSRKVQYPLHSDKNNKNNSKNIVSEDFGRTDKNLRIDLNKNINSKTNNIININNNISSKHYIMSPCYEKKNFMKRFVTNNTSITRTKKNAAQFINLANNNYIKAQYFTNNLENYFFSPPHQESSNQNSENLSINKSKNNTEKKDENFKIMNVCDSTNSGDRKIENFQSNTYGSKNEIVYENYTGKLFNSNLNKFIYANKILCKGSTGKVRSDLISDDNTKQNSSDIKNDKLLISIYKGKLIKIFVKFLNNYCTYFCKSFYSDFFYGLKNYIYKRRFQKKTINKKQKNSYSNGVKYDAITTITSNYSDNNGNFSNVKAKEAQLPLNNLYNSSNYIFSSERKKNFYDNNDIDQGVYSARNKKVLNKNQINMPKFQSSLESNNNSIENQRKKLYPRTLFYYFKMNKNNTISCFKKENNKRIIYNNKNKQKILSNARNFQVKEIKINLEDSNTNNSLNTSSKNSYIHDSCRKSIYNTQYNIYDGNNVIENEEEPKNIVYRKKLENKNNSIHINHNIQNLGINDLDNKNNIYGANGKLKNYTEENLKEYLLNINNNNNNIIYLNNQKSNKDKNIYLKDIYKPFELFDLKRNNYLQNDNNKDVNYYYISSDGLLSIHINHMAFNYYKNNKKLRINHMKTSSYNKKTFMCFNLYSFNIIGKKKLKNNLDSPIAEIAEFEENFQDTESIHKTKKKIKDNNNLMTFIDILENIFNNKIYEYKIVFFNLLKKIGFKYVMTKIFKNKKTDLLKKYFDIYKNQSKPKKKNNVLPVDLDSDLDNENFIINNIDNNVMMDDDFDLIDIENNDNRFDDKKNEISENENESEDGNEEDFQKQNHNIGKIEAETNIISKPIYSRKKVLNTKQNNESKDKNKDLDKKGIRIEYDKKFENFMEVIRLGLIYFALSKKNK